MKAGGDRGPAPSTIVILGAAGDLTRRKLLPAIYNLGLDGLARGVGEGARPSGRSGEDGGGHQKRGEELHGGIITLYWRGIDQFFTLVGRRACFRPF